MEGEEREEEKGGKEKGGRESVLSLHVFFIPFQL